MSEFRPEDYEVISVLVYIDGQQLLVHDQVHKDLPDSAKFHIFRDLLRQAEGVVDGYYDWKKST